MSGIIKVSDARLAMARAIELSKDRPALVYKAPEAEPQLVAVTKHAIEADLPRICAVHDLPYISRYVAYADGVFHYARSFPFDKRQSEQYENKNQIIMPHKYVTHETCPHCFAIGIGAIRCATCKGNICLGRTTAKNFFMCRDSCGGSGQTVHARLDERGISPYLGPRGPRQT